MSRTVAAAALLAAVVAAVPAESFRWRLSDALARAVERNLTLRQRQVDADAKREALEKSWNLYLPGVDAGLTLRRSEAAVEPWSLGGEVEATWDLDATLPDQVTRFRLTHQAALLAYDGARLELTRDVEKIFYQVLLVEERIRLAEQNAELAVRQYDRTLALYNAGQASELDLLTALVARENTIPDLLSLRNSLESLRGRLKQLTGLAAEDDLVLEGEIALPAVDLDKARLLSDVYASSPAVQRLRADLEALEIGRRIADRGARLPSLSLGYSWAPSVPGPLAENIGSPETRDVGTLTLSVRAPLDPLIPHSRDDQRIRGLDAGIEHARIAIERELYITRMEVSNLLNQLAGTEQTLKARELAERRAQEVYTQTLAAYEKGGRELLDVQDAQASLQEAGLAILNEKYNYIAALADLEFAVGRRIFKE